MHTEHNTSPGTFIVFEGNDNSGKTTQANKLFKTLKNQHHQVVRTREPGGTPLAEKIRNIILDPHQTHIDPMTEALLFAAARSSHVKEFIHPNLKAGKIVISDRFIDSSIAYQGAGRNLGIDNITRINHFATAGLTPKLTIILDIDVQQARKRQHANTSPNDRIEAESDQFYTLARRAFLNQAEKHPNLYLVLDATQPAHSLAARILERVTKIL